MQPLKIEIVRKLAENNNAEVREQAIKTLGESGDKSSIILIIKSLSDKNEEVAASAMLALRNLKATDAFNTLKEIFEDKDKSFYIRNTALITIVEIDKNKALAYVKNGINDTNEEIRYVSTNCLNNYDSNVIFSCLVTVLHDKSAYVRKEALNITSIKYLPAYKTHLISCLSDKDTEVRISAMNILAAKNPEDIEIYKLLLKQLNSFDSKDIETALFCLKKYFSQKPLEQIYSLADSTEDALVKYRILEYLEEKGEFDSVPHIRKFTSDGDEDVRNKAESVIQELMGKNARKK
jgi:HEAT repeat protein